MDHYCQSVDINGKLAFKISAVFKRDSLNITIFENETAWNLIVSEDELTEQSKKLKMGSHEYYANLKKYIECRPKDTEFEFKSGKFSVILLLKNKMKMLYFQCQLTKVDFIVAVYGVLDALYSGKVEYHKELSEISNKHTNLKKDYNIVNKKLNEFLEKREYDELNLYNKFIAVLNEKKRQIQHLNDLLIALRQGRPTVNPCVQVKRKITTRLLKNKTNTKNVPTSSESEVDHDSNHYDTDEVEQSNDNKTFQENSMSSPIPSTSRDKNYLPFHSSPKSFTFAKRIRKDNFVNMNIIVPKEESAVDKQQKHISQKSLEFNIKEQPRVDFNTQDLLDNL